MQIASRFGAAIHRASTSLEAVAARQHRAIEPRAKDPFAGVLPWELNSRDALEVPAFDAEIGSLLLEYAGVALINGAIPRARALETGRAACAIADEVRAAVRARGFDPEDATKPFRFAEACSRGAGRLDLRQYKMDELSKLPQDTWLPIVNTALGGDARLLCSGLVVTQPGTAEQAWHADGPPVPREEWQRHGVDCPPPPATLPAHALTVFVPLVDLTAENGPTAFLPGTHASVTSAALAEEAREAGSSAGAGAHVRLEADAGSAILFDYRTFHAGGANRGDRPRPILYFVYARSWYRDVHNWPEESLFASPTLREVADVWENTEVW